MMEGLAWFSIATTLVLFGLASLGVGTMMMVQIIEKVIGV